MLNQNVNLQYEIQEDLDTVRIVVAANVSEVQIDRMLEKIYEQFHHVQKKLHVQFSTNEFKYKQAGNIENWEKVMEQCVFLVDAQKMFDLDVFLQKHLKDNFSIAPISSFTEAEKEAIQIGENVWFPARFHPLKYEAYAKNSLVLRYNEELAGWCIAATTNSQILLYDNLFIKEEYRSLGIGLSLFHHALSIQLNDSPFKYLTFTVHGDNDPMLSILGKHAGNSIVDYKSVVIYEKC